ncbi:DUF4170 domain-containing protein [Pseudoroseomonas ludipueritiae]|uniref:DUF4170 domain-containing protein n=1 Tax=Pseudoroseomonas ludipueritiae TaxID=198093 RepID=A0ABR7R6M5_9PROT|nr:hypothetical protein [Pseudoroseomonas ludipueritiae]MBC9177344.1 hypothetical protein [Pseudoroseomonas ludipueritiae]MCG7361886.1 hypothetical protein [Roseomonas sp. ACRSG]
MNDPLANREIWVVWGGVFRDTSFTELETGTEELHGPFHSMADAEKVWLERMRRMVDIASHRLFVLRAVPASGSAT